MTEYERVREQVAIQLRDNMGYLESLAWSDLCATDREMFYKDAKKILSLNGIEIRADDQSLPAFEPNVYEDFYALAFPNTSNAGYQKAQQDMLKAGFIKVAPKEEYGS